MSRVQLCLFMLATLIPVHAFGQRSCLPEFTSLQTFDVVSPTQTRQLRYYLQSERVDGRFMTKAMLYATPNAGDPHELQLKLLFDPEFDGVSLAYNVYAVQVVLNGEPAYWLDLT